MSKTATTRIKTTDILGSLILFTFCSYLSLSIVANELRDHKGQDVRRGAETLALQLSGASKLTAKRAIASVDGKVAKGPGLRLGEQGVISSDPWGVPYQYKFIKDSRGHVRMVAVWSYGPNSRPDTAPQVLEYDMIKVEPNRFSGDDFGFIKMVDSSDNKPSQ